MTDNKAYIYSLCCDEVSEEIVNQLAADLDKRDAEIARLRKGIEDWLKRMDYYSDNQYGKRQMKELLQ